MNTTSLFVFIATTALNSTVKEDHVTTPVLSKNVSSKVDNFLHNVTDKLFTSLKVELDSQISEKNSLLHKLQNNFRAIAENNDKAITQIQIASKIDRDKELVNPLFNLTEVIDEIFDKKYCIFKNNTKRISKKVIAVTRLTKNYASSVEDSAGPNMFRTFIHRFLDKIDILSNITKAQFPPKIKTKHSLTVTGLVPTRKRAELKAWVFSNSSEDYVKTRRIYKGKKAKVTKYPFVVSLHMKEDFICAGSIISKDLVITAAACMQLAYPDKIFKPNIITVRAGSDETDKFGEEIPITDVYFHPKYDSKYFKNNLALIRIMKTLSFKRKDKKVRRIDFDRTDMKLAESGGLTMLGWGDKDSYSRYNGPLTFARLEIYGLEACKEIYSEHYVNDNNFCAGFVSMGSGACNRDVGGPGIIGSKLMGVISFGPPTCGTPDAPTVFTKIGFFTDWIDGIIQTESVQQDYVTKKLPTVTKNSLVRQHNAIQLNRAPREPKISSSYIHPKEINILKKLFQDLLRSGNLTLDELLEPIDDSPLKSTTTKSKPSRKSIATTTTEAGLWSQRSVEASEEDEPEYADSDLEKATRGRINKKTTKKNEVVTEKASTENGHSVEDSKASQEYSENYEANDEGEGISIEGKKGRSKESQSVESTEGNTSPEVTTKSTKYNKKNESKQPKVKQNQNRYKNTRHRPKHPISKEHNPVKADLRRDVGNKDNKDSEASSEVNSDQDAKHDDNITNFFKYDIS